MQEKTLMHVFRTRICTKHYQALLSDMEQICDTKSLFHSTKEHQRCSAGYLFNNTSFTLRCESQGKYITHDFAGQQRTKHTIWSTKSSLGYTARTKHSWIKQPSPEKDTNTICAWALISASSGTGPQAQIEIRLHKAAGSTLACESWKLHLSANSNCMNHILLKRVILLFLIFALISAHSSLTLSWREIRYHSHCSVISSWQKRFNASYYTHIHN